jgi:hypothetical protein
MIDVLLNAALPEAERTGVAEWPAQVREASGEKPADGWLRMSAEEYAAYRATHEAAQDAWTRAGRLLDARAGALSRLAEYRWQREIEGVRVGDMLIETDREARGSLTSAVVLAQMAMMQGQPFRVPWKTREGFRELDAAALIEAGQAAAAHVAGCFAREKAIAGQIEMMTDPDALDALDMQVVWATGEAR